ncbi:MAG: Gfo/Idh/MocA family oxidoreductase [Candidatus Bathyarchaeia archaeon]
MVDKLRVGFIGSGFATRFHILGWVGVRNAEITAIYNIRERSARELASLAENLGVGKPKVYTDIFEMLSSKSVDAVWIANPNFARLDVVKSIVEEVKQGRSDLIGVCCEKPLARNVDEAEALVKMIEEVGLLHGYLENQVFMPSVVKGRDILWRYGARYTKRPYLARAAEEHGGPHSSWFWNARLSGGGVMLDMMCHSLEAARFLLSNPEDSKSSLKPKTVYAEIASLKWAQEPYVSTLRDRFRGEVDYSKEPAEDYALAIVTYEAEDGSLIVSETRTSWSFTGPALRLSFEVLGPEYSMTINTLQPELFMFFSRNVKIPPTEEFVEKQVAEQGLIPTIPNEAFTYGYMDEDRYMVDCFINGRRPREDWTDGLLIVQLMMACYMSAEQGKKVKFNPEVLRGFIPAVAKGLWKPKTLAEAP